MISFFAVERGAGKRRRKEGGVIYFTSVGCGGGQRKHEGFLVWGEMSFYDHSGYTFPICSRNGPVKMSEVCT